MKKFIVTIMKAILAMILVIGFFALYGMSESNKYAKDIPLSKININLLECTSNLTNLSTEMKVNITITNNSNNDFVGKITSTACDLQGHSEPTIVGYYSADFTEDKPLKKGEVIYGNYRIKFGDNGYTKFNYKSSIEGNFLK